MRFQGRWKKASFNKCTFGWLFWGLTALETVFQSISGCLPERDRERERREMIDKRKMSKTTHTRTYCKRNRPLPYYYPNQ